MKNCCEDFLERLDNLIHDQIDNNIGAVRVWEFREKKELLEEEFAEWLWNKFIKERCNDKDNS